MTCKHLADNGMTTTIEIIKDDKGIITGYDIKCYQCEAKLTKKAWDKLIEYVKVKHEEGEPYV